LHSFLTFWLAVHRREKIDGQRCGHINCQWPPNETEASPGAGGLESCRKHTSPSQNVGGDGVKQCKMAVAPTKKQRIRQQKKREIEKQYRH